MRRKAMDPDDWSADRFFTKLIASLSDQLIGFFFDCRAILTPINYMSNSEQFPGISMCLIAVG